MRIHFHLILFGCFLQFMAISHSQNTYFYKGSIDGSISITCQLDVRGDRCQGKFYTDATKEIKQLSGKISGSSIWINEKNQTGELTQKVFRVKIKKNWDELVGSYYDKTYQSSVPFKLIRIQETENLNKEMNFKKLMAFQDFINQFSNKVKIPLALYADSDQNSIRSMYLGVESDLDELESTLPYYLAKRFIMDQVPWPVVGPLDYLNVDRKDYHQQFIYYRPIGRLFFNDRFISILLHFKYKNGWDNYDIMYAINFDFTGNYIDSKEIAKGLDIRTKNTELKERINSSITADFTVRLRGFRQIFERTTSDPPSYRKNKRNISQRFKLMKNGTYRKENQ